MRVWITVCIALFVTSIFTAVYAADPKVAAEAAYDAATQAHSEGDYARAAKLFAVADELAPNPVALETALREAILADAPALAMTLSLRSTRESSPSTALQDAVNAAAARFGGRVGFIAVECTHCKATLDGEELRVTSGPLRVLNAVEAGPRSIELSTTDGVEKQTVEVVAFKTVVVQPTPPKPALPIPAAPAIPQRRLHGIHPAWITLGIVGTAALGGASIASYVDTLGIQSDLQAKRDQNDLTGAEALASSGRAAEVRTYVLEGLCAGSGVATILVAIFAIDWNGPEPDKKRSGSVLVSPGGASFEWRF